MHPCFTSLLRKRKKHEKKETGTTDKLSGSDSGKAEGLKWHKDFRDRVILEVKNEGFFNGIAQKVFNRPEVTKIHLDVHGSYLWPFIDGERTVMDLAALEKERFGEAAEPLYPRIVKYFQILENNHFVSFK